MMVPITVFTPTYNRKDLLIRCYESLRNQTIKDFIWLIVDDGSNDNTGELVCDWLKEFTEFEIKYYYKENGGLHTAYNEAIKHIGTELCVCIDSDDFLTNDAIEKILNFWSKNGSKRYAGIVCLDCYLNGTIIGDLLPDQKSISSIDLLTGKYRIKNGDRTYIVRTELYKRFTPINGYPGEKYYNPHCLHLKICKDYDFLVLNEVLRFVDYQDDGMSKKILYQYKNSPNNFGEIRKLYLSFSNTPIIFRIRHTIHMVSSYILAHKFYKIFSESPNLLITLFAIPFGWLLSVYIRLKTH